MTPIRSAIVLQRLRVLLMRDTDVRLTVHKHYQRIKQPVAFGLVIVLLVAVQFRMPGLRLGALGLLSAILAESVFAIQATLRKRSTEPPLEQFFSACQTVRGEMQMRLVTNGRLTVRALGVSMTHAWPLLSSTLESFAVLFDGHIDLHIAMLDSEWTPVSTMHPQLAEQAHVNFRAIRRYAETHPAFRERGWTLRVSRYAAATLPHGLLVDDDLLFISTFSWWDRQSTPGGHCYELLSARDSAFATGRIKEFKAAFDAIEKKRVEPWSDPLNLVAQSSFYEKCGMTMGGAIGHRTRKQKP
jgi:hypothetical protein